MSDDPNVQKQISITDAATWSIQLYTNNNQLDTKQLIQLSSLQEILHDLENNIYEKVSEYISKQDRLFKGKKVCITAESSNKQVLGCTSIKYETPEIYMNHFTTQGDSASLLLTPSSNTDLVNFFLISRFIADLDRTDTPYNDRDTKGADYDRHYNLEKHTLSLGDGAKEHWYTKTDLVTSFSYTGSDGARLADKLQGKATPEARAIFKAYAGNMATILVDIFKQNDDYLTACNELIANKDIVIAHDGTPKERLLKDENLYAVCTFASKNPELQITGDSELGYDPNEL